MPPSSSFCFSCFVEPPENCLAQREAPVEQELRETQQPGAVRGHSPGKSLRGCHQGLGKGCGKQGLSFCWHPTRPCLSLRSLHNKRLYLAVFAAVLGNFSFGFALVYPSPVIPALEAHPNPALRLDQHTAPWFGVRSGVIPARVGKSRGVPGGMPGSHSALVRGKELGTRVGAQPGDARGDARLTQPLSMPRSRCSRWERRRAGSARCCSTTAWAAS